ncbi:hypothetical protein KC867_03365 [Candidatus Saccharibacteria bacterium]|nr:hypothetical protein [Candidatus Saccharibacteria bacterium]
MAKDIQFVDKSTDSYAINSSTKGGKIVINEREEFFAALERAESLVKGESPRAKVLIYVSAIERSLQEVLRNVLVPSNQKEDILLSETANTFESQIDLAFRTGVISHNLWRDLHILRELRDDCYGRIENFSFEHSAIKSSVAMLERNIGKKTFIGLPVMRMDTEDKFSFIARTFWITIEQTKDRVGRISEAKAENLYKDN